MINNPIAKWTRRIAAVVLLGAASGAPVVLGQEKPAPPGPVVIRPGDGPDFEVSAAQKEEVIDTLLQKLKEQYVFPDVADQMAKAIRERAQRQEYEKVTSGKEFAKLLTSHLQEVSKDKHLRVNAGAQPGRPSPKAGPARKTMRACWPFRRRPTRGL
jgi:hypothetical protein